MPFENIPAVTANKIDGNLQVSAINENPVVLIIGSSPSGASHTLFTVDSPSTAASTFGRNDGTLIRGMYEAIAGGAENLRLFRIGATSATLATIGSGVTLETVREDDTAGLDYKLFYDDTTLRLRVYRVSDSILVYDNNPAYPSGKVDLNEVSVSGTYTTGPGDIGTLAVPITMAAADGVSGAAYTAGTDGITMSRMALYEELHRSYKLLEGQDLDMVVPMNVYIDDSNVDDMTTAQVTTFNTGAAWAAGSVYPEPGDADDGLGEVFAQEYLGKWYFWWDTDRDNVAEIFPTAGSASATLDTAGTALTSSDFHVVNFGYQLANFLYTESRDSNEMLGSIGVLPPNSWSLADVSNWVGKALTVAAINTDGNSVITTNGSGLLGQRWMAGRLGNAGSGLSGHIVNGIDGLSDGGFIATDDGWIDGDQQTDRNDHVIDIGKYLSVVGAQAILANVTNPTAYAASGAAVYAGFVTSLPPNESPSNQVISGVRLPFKVGLSKLDALAGKRFVFFHRKSKGTVVTDAPTAARTDSDYQRLTTIRIVKAVIDGMRAVAEPYLGKTLSGAKQASLETGLDRSLSRFKKLEYLRRYEKALNITATQRILGQATLELLLVPEFELRQLTIQVALASQ